MCATKTNTTHLRTDENTITALCCDFLPNLLDLRNQRSLRMRWAVRQFWEDERFLHSDGSADERERNQEELLLLL